MFQPQQRLLQAVLNGGWPGIFWRLIFAFGQDPAGYLTADLGKTGTGHFGPAKSWPGAFWSWILAFGQAPAGY